MDSDLLNRLRQVLAALPAGNAPSVPALATLLGIPENQVETALQSLATPSSPLAVDQTVHGTANTQVGQGNTQVNIQGSLVQPEAEIPSVEALRQLMLNPDELHDVLEAQLVVRRSRRALTRVLEVSTEHPDWEALFTTWIRQTPELHGKPWFAEPTISHYSVALTPEAAGNRYQLLRLLFEGLLDAGQEEKATEMCMLFLNNLGNYSAR